MLLKNSLANQETVQAKRQQGKKAAERVGKRKKNCSVCECSFYSSSEQITINFQAFAVHLNGCLCACMWHRKE